MGLYAGEHVILEVDVTEPKAGVPLLADPTSVKVSVKAKDGSATPVDAQVMSLVVDETGTSTGSNTSSTLKDTGKDFETDAHGKTTKGRFAGAVLKITGGTGSGQVRRIKSHTATELTIVGTWTTTPDNTSVYQVHRRHYEYAWASDTTHGNIDYLQQTEAVDAAGQKSFEEKVLRLEAKLT